MLVLASLCAFIKSGLYYLEVSWIWKWKVDYLCISTSCSLHCFIFTFCSSKIMQYRCQRNANKLLTYVPFRWCYDELVSEWTLWLPIRHSSLVNMPIPLLRIFFEKCFTLYRLHMWHAFISHSFCIIFPPWTVKRNAIFFWRLIFICKQVSIGAAEGEIYKT